ncbi:hypothetical protein MVEN_02226400 [Mycena venus]|uniref:MYND-type domain-containing protein n=1 Tax=Mycena venus TaxID=2733690 RepID=A0A8H7CFG2_9AGAR|nr:hypothetical protein MVEN_02226400 [Mycena venus]
MGFGDSPKSPSFETDRRGWNSAWERDLATVYGTGLEISPASRRPVPSIVADLPKQYYEMMLADAQRMTLSLTGRPVVQTKSAKILFLEGLVRACKASPDFEDHRKWCPELTLKRLNRDSGKGFVELLKQLTLQDLDKVPDDIKTVPNAVYDKINALPANPHPGLVVAKKSCDCGRTYLLTMVVWNVLLAFYGESEQYGLIKGQRDDPEHLKRLKKSLSGEVDVKRVASETAANRQRAERHCTSCGLPASKAGVETLSACQRCKAIDRLVFYCSKKCQVADWKTGRPPHKTICGKVGAIRDAYFAPKPTEPTPAEDDDDDFPPPNPGYVRSPALLHQLKLLKENPQMDYVLVRPDPHPDHGVILQDPLGSMFFKVCMNRAVCDHSPREVFKMFQQLEPTARNAPGFGVEKLKKQMLKEYGIDVDAVKAEHYSS